MLTKRLEKIIAVLPKCQTLADIGCDHGYIGLEALRRGIADEVIFVDISAPSLQKAKNNCDVDLLTRANFVCQNGLQNIECDCAIIAGMGGLEIISVLQNACILPQYLVLQPMRSQQEVRKFLQSDYKIDLDEKFFDGKFYDLVFAEKSSEGSVLSDDEIEFGKTNLAYPSTDFLHYLEVLTDKYRQISAQCDDEEILKKLACTERMLNVSQAKAKQLTK